jgi:hypothetical protein
MLKMLVKLAVAGLLTLLLAAVFLARNISDNLATMSVRNGDWTTSTSIGSESAGVLLKAAVALGGLLASTPENSMYYRLDSVDGEPLRLNCRYRIKGKDYDADWWSITVYGWDNYLIPNAQKRYAFNNENIERHEDGSWEIVVDRNQQAGNWLPVGPSGASAWRKLVNYDFDLLLRLYTPGTAYLQMPQSAQLPRVTLEACE